MKIVQILHSLPTEQSKRVVTYFAGIFAFCLIYVRYYGLLYMKYKNNPFFRWTAAWSTERIIEQSRNKYENNAAVDDIADGRVKFHE